MKIILYPTTELNIIKDIIDNVEKYKVSEVGEIKENLRFVENYKEFTICFNEDKKYYIAISKNEAPSENSIKPPSENLKSNNKIIIIIVAIAIIIAILSISEGNSNGNSFTPSSEDVAVEYVRNSMKNPSSFELVTKSVETSNDGAIVDITYRGTNSFNAVVTEEKKVYLNKNNDVIGVE